ncbi:MAG: bifunctional fucokinase/L-fucose-1-P-guanylyltransferase, partial [Bacteroidaceae bacterium]|nr:bifunctional fucokinase/L-fucose-1-P-guanylyltransferase [Bacteroidaceae bacterium]
MKKLLSLPPNLVECFHDIAQVEKTEWFCTSDPVGSKLGSGGGTAWLLEACQKDWAPDLGFMEWLGREKRILLHAGGQSRRLPGYAPSGKVLTPVPVFRWARGQRLSQNLLSLQLPLYEQIMKNAPESLHTLIASGDVYIRSSKPLQKIPEADVVCYGLWVDPNLAKNHGVFVSSRRNPDKLDYMLQKPSVEKLGALMQTHLFLMDIGIWLLSDRAVELLMKRSYKNGELGFYDMYSEFGLALGEHPRIKDEELNQLSVAILPLPGGEFYHYGTSRELISSTLSVQNIVIDQREIMHRKVKPHPAMFVQNAKLEIPLTANNPEVWIENSFVGKSWKLHHKTIVTGVPVNDWALDVPAGVCVDVVPMDEKAYVARPYGFEDAFKGALEHVGTTYLGKPMVEWMSDRGLSLDMFERTDDLQAVRMFPVTDSIEELGLMMRWMISEPQLQAGKECWMRCRKVSADEISSFANLRRLVEQREEFCKMNWGALAKNYEYSVFYQLNLEDAAQKYAVHA